MSKKPFLWLLVAVAGLLAANVGCSSSVSGSNSPELTERTAAALSVTWTDVVGVSTSGNSLTKTAGDGWNAGAASNESISGDGNMQFTTAEATTHKMAGLTHAVTDSSYDTIDFAIYLIADGDVDIFEDGVLINQGFGTYVAGDVFSVTVSGGVVTYLKNGSLLYTSTKTPQFPLVVDASLYSQGATVNNVSLSSAAFWQNIVGVSTASNSVTKTAGAGWNAGASSISSLSGDGTASFTTAETTTHKMAGLTHAVNDSSYDTIDYAIYLIAGGNVDIFEDGVLINQGFGSYVAGDVFSVEVSGSVVTYLKNGALLYTSTKTPTFPLYVDTSLYSTGATIQNVSLGSTAFWQNVVGVTTSGQGVTKTGDTGWNSGASTVSSLSGNGSASFTTAEATTHKMAGLTHAVTDSSYDTIDYAIYMIADGNVDIFEDGTLINQGFGTYVAGDVFSIQVTGSVVTYLKNGSLLYTSTKTPTFPLYVDTSLYTTGATVQNVTFH